MVPRHIIDVVPDEHIILSYVTCSGCDEMLVSEDDLAEAIAKCKDVDEFVAFTDELLRQHRAEQRQVVNEPPEAVEACG
jgi:hypothetical protein